MLCVYKFEIYTVFKLVFSINGFHRVFRKQRRHFWTPSRPMRAKRTYRKIDSRQNKLLPYVILPSSFSILLPLSLFLTPRFHFVSPLSFYLQNSFLFSRSLSYFWEAISKLPFSTDG